MTGRKKSSSSNSVDNASKSKTKLNQRSILDHFTKRPAPELNHKAEPDLNTNGLHVELPQSGEEDVLEQADVSVTLARQENAVVGEPSSHSILLPSNELFDSETNPEPPETSSPALIDLVDDDDVPSHIASLSCSTQSLGTRKENPIIIDSSPVKVKVNALANDNIPNIGSSSVVKHTIKPTQKSTPKQVYSIFAPRPSATATSTSVVDSTNVSGRFSEAPYPNQTSQHVQGPQTKYSSRYTPLPLRHRAPNSRNNSSLSLKNTIFIRDDDTCSPISTQKFSVHVSSSLPTREAHLATIPTEHQQLHPAIAHVVKATCTVSANSAAPSKLWTEKWRPTRAAHVLGNEHHAEYLRQWLCALEVQLDTLPAATTSSQPNGKAKGRVKEEKRGTKRPRVVRAVTKKPGRKKQRIDSDEEGDWIVYSDDSLEDEEPVSTRGDDDEYVEDRPPRLYRRLSHDHGQATLSPCNQNIVHEHTFDERLTNTILLTGPHGCGKTAAVYACAEELGWEVFEVYPGIGKRSGANLENLVGEVGRNHLVRKAQLWDKKSETKKTGDSSTSSFPRSKRFDNWQSSPSSRFVEQGDQPPEGGSELRLTVRQSFILLEEVDVLFREDANFWPAVINLIKDCKRPVILTCNDVSLVPVADLPLQEILNFESCAVDVATSLLQAVCCAENHLVERSTISRLYENCSWSQNDRPPDLRRTLHCLQMWCPAKAKEERTVLRYQDNSDLEDLINWQWPLPGTKSSDASNQSFHDRYTIGNLESSHAELISFADCYLMRNWMDTLEREEIKQSGDDVLGHTTLHNAGSASNQECMGYHDRDWLIVSSAIDISRGALKNPPRYSSSAKDTRAFLETRVQYEGLLKELRHNVAVAETQITRRTAFDLDYLPWVREIIVGDDKQEGEMVEGRGGRMTRNKTKYIRTIEVSEKARERLCMTALE